jgi:uncharacterized membrane protein
MPKAKIIAVLLFAALFFAACAGSESNFASNSAAPGTGESEVAKTDSADDGSSGDDLQRKEVAQNQVSLEQNEQTPAEPEKPIERKIIRNADLQLESDSPEEAQQKITAIAEGKDGYIVTTQKTTSPRTGKGETVNMTLRVPSEKFNETLDEIRKTGSRVVSENITGEDITDKFVDMQARLKAEKALEEQFLEIMKRSNTVQDALNVQRQIADVRGKIEQMEGRLRQWEKLASLSTIKVTIQTPTAISGSSEGFFYRLKDSISTGLDGALSFILGFIMVLIAILPFLLLVVLPIFLLLRYFWRKTKKKIQKHDTQEIVKEEIRED